ncbi:MAG: hypothetical protein GEU97_10895 [Actinophytocola sp.]|nr:hypothetical protein [Actinophytocola sp.]
MTRARAQLPANPMSISLAFTHRRLWWQTDDGDHMPERWDVSADVGRLVACPADHRHVGDIELVIADLRRKRNPLDSAELGEWALEFIAEAVIDPEYGRFAPELDALLSDGVARMVIVRGFHIVEAWRGHGLGALLIAGTLRSLARAARLAACRVAPDGFRNTTADRVSAELASVRIGAMLEKIGFVRWNGVHVIDLRDPALLDVRLDVLDQW